VWTVTLMERFMRLYDLSIHQELTMGAMHALGWGENGEAWGWRHRLLAWEEDLVVEIRNLLYNVTLQESGEDVWMWRLSRHFLEIKSIWLAFDSLLFTTELLINFQKYGKKINHHFKRLRVRVLVIFREGVSTLNIHSILLEPLELFS